MKRDQPAGSAGNGLFLGMRHRIFVEVNTAGEVKNALARAVDVGL